MKKKIRTPIFQYKAQIIAAAAAVATMAAGYLWLDRDSAAPAAPSPISTPSTDPAPAPVDSRVFEIAAHFACSCGQCGEQSLDICECERAKEQRRFIDDLLRQGHSKNEIIARVHEKYGHLKDKELEEDPTPALDNASAPPGVAHMNDFTAIVSRFACFCGQCGMDSLLECDCQHDHGAQEVKAYIRRTIAEHHYTVEEIVSLVNLKFGNDAANFGR